MIVAITGTPGTGKTSVARELAALLEYELVDVNEAIESGDVETEEDTERGALAVDVDELVEELEQRVNEDSVVDGHLSHFYPADAVFVLRCGPGELRKRLRAKGWGEDKIGENVEAEALDTVLQEAVGRNEEVYEVDTTDGSPKDVAQIIKDILANKEEHERYRPGHIDWSEEFFAGD